MSWASRLSTYNDISSSNPKSPKVHHWTISNILLESLLGLRGVDSRRPSNSSCVYVHICVADSGKWSRRAVFLVEGRYAC